MKVATDHTTDLSTTAAAVLLVERHESVRELMEVLLCRDGFHVLSAANGTDALELARQTPKIDLLMSNIDPLGIPGDELAARFVRLHPSAAIVLVSSSPDRNKSTEPFGFLAKPFNIAELRETVHRALQMRPVLDANSCAA